MGMKKMPRYAWLLIFGAVNLISFLIFFIPNYVMLDYDIGYFEYFRLFNLSEGKLDFYNVRSCGNT